MIRNIEHTDPAILLSVMKKMYPELHFSINDILSKRKSYGDNLKQLGVYMGDYLISYANVFYMPTAQSVTVALFYERTKPGLRAAAYLADYVLRRKFLCGKVCIKQVAAYSEKKSFFFYYLLSRNFRIISESIDWKHEGKKKNLDRRLRIGSSADRFLSCTARAKESLFNLTPVSLAEAKNNPTLSKGLFDFYMLQNDKEKRFFYHVYKDIIDAPIREPKINLHASTMLVDKGTMSVLGVGLVINTADGLKIKKILFRQQKPSINVVGDVGSVARVLLQQILEEVRRQDLPLWLNTMGTNDPYPCIQAIAEECGFVPKYQWVTMAANTPKQ